MTKRSQTLSKALDSNRVTGREVERCGVVVDSWSRQTEVVWIAGRSGGWDLVQSEMFWYTALKDERRGFSSGRRV